MYRTFRFLLILCGAVLLYSASASAHCQVPCGIYDDHARVKTMLEDSATVIKAVRMMNGLAGKTDAQSQNQMVRWVMNKEKHAQNIIAAISDYFLTQRVKPSQGDYSERLARHHAVIIAAMKAKQSASETHALALEKAVMALEGYYAHP
ncbi:MAG: superoxide dismutase [Desulfobacteraceae bacterium]|nr:MAG: superoxide dismutase [Desulfobacteraceae bacterium]